TCLVPSTVKRTGEAYSGLSSAHCHSWSPVTRLKAMIAPLPCPPRCAMAIPSTMIGDMAVKNLGTTLANGPLRQTTSPEAASKHERTPATPRVTVFPSATAGELRGPGCRDAGPPTAAAPYLCKRPVNHIFPFSGLA